MRITLCILLLCAAGTGTGCGGGARDAGEAGTGRAAVPGPLDACALFTPEDAVRLLGGEVGEPNRGADMHDEASGRALSNCGYTAGATMRSANVLIRRSPGEPQPASLEQARAEARSAVAGQEDEDLRALAEIGARLVEEGEAVPGIGRVAWWSAEARQLTAYVAPHWMIVVSASPGPGEEGPGAPAAAVELARLVASRL